MNTKEQQAAFEVLMNDEKEKLHGEVYVKGAKILTIDDKAFFDAIEKEAAEELVDGPAQNGVSFN